MFNLLQVVFFALGLWVASRAKPLETMPYRWGTWVGLQTAWTAVVVVIWCITGPVGASLVLTAALYMLALSSAVASFGILRRKRFGVVVFVGSYLLFLLIFPFLDTVPGESYRIREAPLSAFVSRISSFPIIIGIISTAMSFVCTVIYFKRRWPFMNDHSIQGDLGPTQIQHGSA